MAARLGGGRIGSSACGRYGGGIGGHLRLVGGGHCQEPQPDFSESHWKKKARQNGLQMTHINFLLTTFSCESLGRFAVNSSNHLTELVPLILGHESTQRDTPLRTRHATRYMTYDTSDFLPDFWTEIQPLAPARLQRARGPHREMGRHSSNLRVKVPATEPSTPATAG